MKVEAIANEDTRKVLVTVTNGGIAVPLELREKIFQPFFTTKPVGKGTGLGLSLSRKIAQEHGGELYLDHSCPKTKFVLELPRAQHRA